ncbi:hypothetical protein HHI36_017571, partial [Cryptolaemus montrouzieri]
ELTHQTPEQKNSSTAWTKVTYKKNKGKRFNSEMSSPSCTTINQPLNDANRSLQRPIPIIGTGDSANGFSAKKSYGWIFLSRVQKGTDKGEIVDYLKKKFPNSDFDVTNLNSKSEHHDFFRVQSDLSDVNSLMNPGIWPSGVLVRRYRFFRNRPTEGSFNNS